MKGFTITIRAAEARKSIRRGTKFKCDSFAFRDKSKYCRKQKHKKAFD